MTVIAFNCLATLYHGTSNESESNCDVVRRAPLLLLFTSLSFFKKNWGKNAQQEPSSKCNTRVVQRWRSHPNTAGLTFKRAFFSSLPPRPPVPHPLLTTNPSKHTVACLPAVKHNWIAGEDKHQEMFADKITSEKQQRWPMR